MGAIGLEVLYVTHLIAIVYDFSITKKMQIAVQAI